MYSIEQIFKQLACIEKYMQDVNFNSSELSHLENQLSALSTQVKVRHSLSTTVSQLEEESTSRQSKSKMLQSRVEKFIRVVHGGEKCASSTDHSRWVSLRDLDCKTFLFIAASYTPSDVAKMSRTEFEFLVASAPEYLKHIGSKWMFRKPFQFAVASLGGLPDVSQFKRKYHDLEYSTPDVQEPQKRPRTPDVEKSQKRPCTEEQQEMTRVTSSTGAETGTGLGIETAFDMTPKVFEQIWKKLSNEWVPGEPQSIILTIPAEDRVASIMHSIPRKQAIIYGEEYKLQKLSLPTSA